MANKSRNRKNLPPTGQGKKQSPFPGEANKLRKRSVVIQARPHHPELNLGDSEEEAAERSRGPRERPNPKRPKAGR